MICNSFDNLTIVEKVQFIGKLMHLVQSSEVAFKEAELMIRCADDVGMFKGTTILPFQNVTDDLNKA